jgi:hypothetical protein
MAFTGDKAPDTPEASSSSSHVSASLTGGDYPRPKLLTAQSAPRSDASSTSSDPQPTSHRSATPPTSAYSTPDAPDSSKSPLDNYDLAVLEFVPSSSPRITGTATPESASASASGEAADELGPLPGTATVALSNRPKIPRLASLPANLATHLPLFSPQRGISELLSGSPYTPATDYFSSSHSEPPSLSRSGSIRRSPYSPFISYYGDLSTAGRRSSSAEQTDALAASRSPTPPAISSVQSFTPEAPVASPLRNTSPRIRNTGQILAPHGTFTSSVKRPSLGESSRSSATTSIGSRQSHDTAQVAHHPSPADTMDAGEHAALLRAARTGDQLALYRLGMRPDRVEQRYSLGNVEDVWGAVDP